MCQIIAALHYLMHWAVVEYHPWFRDHVIKEWLALVPAHVA